MKFVIKRARRGVLRRRQWTFRMIAGNGQDVGGGETYNNKADCAAAVDLIIGEAARADVEWEDL